MKNRNWFWGVFFILAAVFVVASQVMSLGHISFLSLLGTVLLLALFIHSLIRLEFFGIFLPVALLYMIYEKPLMLPHISVWILILAAVFLSIGFSSLFHSRIHKKWCCGREEWQHSKQTVENIDDNNPVAKVSFGSSSKYLHSDCLKSGQFSVSFGNLEVFFDQATIAPEGAEIFVDCSFGAIKLYVPRHWRVIDNIHTGLGGVENDTRLASPAPEAPKLTLAGNVQLGGVEIHYI